MNQCKVCNKVCKGRADKIFCSKDCSNKFHHAKRKKQIDIITTTNAILLKNRNILAEIFEKEKRKKLKVEKLFLSKKGFNFQYNTGIYFNRERKLYHYVYDYAWMEFSTQEVLIVRK